MTRRMTVRGRATSAAAGALLVATALGACSSTSAEPETSTPASSAASPAASPSAAASTPASSPASNPASNPASSAAATTAPSVLRVKVLSQLKDPVDPSACASADATAGAPAGAPVTVATGDGTVLATAPLRVPEEGEAYGPGGHTFDGWDDLDVVDGAKVTYACFYLAEFPELPAADTYVISLEGAAADVETTPAQLAESEGWVLQVIG